MLASAAVLEEREAREHDHPRGGECGDTHGLHNEESRDPLQESVLTTAQTSP